MLNVSTTRRDIYINAILKKDSDKAVTLSESDRQFHEAAADITTQ